MDPAISKLQKAFQEYGDVITAERAIDSANFRKENEMPKHTPGPWSRNIKPAKKYNTIFAGRNIHICHLETTGLTDEEIEANCDLIRAAPELLAELENNLEDMLKMGWAVSAEKHLLARYVRAKATISKARGETCA